MQYKLSKEQWLEIGQKAGWFKKAAIAAHPENIAWMRSLPAPVVAKVREILTKPHSSARAKALRDALKSGGVSYNKWIPDASAGAEVLGHQFQEAFAKPSDIARQEEKGRAFFATASEEEIKKHIDSIEESSAQDLADNLAGERDMMRESANGARRAAMSADAGGDADDYRFQLKLEKQKIEVADKFAKALAMLTARFPNVKTPEPAKLMDMAESMEALSQKEHEQALNQRALQEDADRELRLPGLRANTPR